MEVAESIGSSEDNKDQPSSSIKQEKNKGSSGSSENFQLVTQEDMIAKLGITAIDFDGLKETANIGTGHAAVALSNILKKKVNISLPDMKLSKFSEVSSVVSFPAGMVVGIYSKVEEGLKGNIITIFPFDVANNLIKLFFPEKAESKSDKLEEEDKKLLTKLGIATYMSYLSSLGKFFEKKIYFDPPNIVTSFGDSIFDFMSLGVDDQGDVLVIRLGFDVEKTDVKGDFLLLFTADSLQEVLSSLKNKVKA